MGDPQSVENDFEERPVFCLASGLLDRESLGDIPIQLWINVPLAAQPKDWLNCMNDRMTSESRSVHHVHRCQQLTHSLISREVVAIPRGCRSGFSIS